VKEANFSFFHQEPQRSAVAEGGFCKAKLLKNICAFRREVYTGEAGDAIASGHPASFAVHCKTRGALPD